MEMYWTANPGRPPPPCPGGSPAGEGLAIVTFSPDVCEKKRVTNPFLFGHRLVPKNESRLP